MYLSKNLSFYLKTVSLIGVCLLAGCVSWTVNTKPGQPRSESIDRKNHVTAINNVRLKASSSGTTVTIDATAELEYVILEKKSVSGPAMRQRATFGLFPGSALVYKEEVGNFKIESYKERMGIFNLLNPIFLWDVYCTVVGGGSVVAVCVPIATTWTTFVSPWYSLEHEARNEELLYMGLSLFGCVRQSLPENFTVTEASETVSNTYFSKDISLSGCIVECEIPEIGYKNRQMLDFNGRATFHVNAKTSGYVKVRLALVDLPVDDNKKYLSRHLHKSQTQKVYLSQ